MSEESAKPAVSLSAEHPNLNIYGFRMLRSLTELMSLSEEPKKSGLAARNP
jgi:hypothetical protein